MLKYIVALMAIATLTFAAEGHGNRPFDTDGDKALNKTEWVARAAARFDAFDTDKNGVVTREEAKAGREKWKEARKERKEAKK
jgi:hypothetical protein